jgi:RNA polymerase-interacting CarD/CdnL/TRCF family regulator
MNSEKLKETIANIVKEESEYQVFFRKALEKAGKSITDMSDEEKKAFFNKIDATWDSKGEKNEGNAFGAAVVAAKKAGEDEFEVGGKTFKVEESTIESVVTEGAGTEAMGIAAFTGTRGDAVQKFIDDNKLDAKKLFNYVKVGKLKERMDFVTALVGNPGNKIQKMIISKFGMKESVNEAANSKGYKPKNDFGARIVQAIDTNIKEANPKYLKKDGVDNAKILEYGKSFFDVVRNGIKAAFKFNYKIHPDVEFPMRRPKGNYFWFDSKEDMEKYLKKFLSDLKKLDAMIVNYQKKPTLKAQQEICDFWNFEVMVGSSQTGAMGPGIARSDRSGQSMYESVNEGVGTIALGVAGGLLLLKLLKVVAKKVVGTIGMNVPLPKEKLHQTTDEVFKQAIFTGGKLNILNYIALKSVIKEMIDKGEITKLSQIVKAFEKASKEGVKQESVTESKLPAGIEQKMKQAIQKIEDAKLNPTQKLELLLKMIDSLGIGKSQLGTMTSKIKSKMESVTESHFKVGDKVKMSHGGVGVVKSLDKEDGADDEKYYGVQLPNGEIHKHSPNELSLVNEGVSSTDMDKIKGAVEAASSFMSVGSELKKLGMKYTFATEPLPIYIIQPTPNNKVAIVNKKYASKPDFVVGDIAVGIMEGKLNEEEIKWNAVENAIINFLKMNTKILDKRVKDRDTDGVKGGLKSIISGLTNAQRNLKLESVNELKKLPNGNFSIKKGYNTFADYEKNAKPGDTILKYDKRGGMIKTFVSGSELHQNAKKYLSKVHSIVGDKVNLSLFGKQGIATVPDYEKKEVGVLVLESVNEAKFKVLASFGGYDLIEAPTEKDMIISKNGKKVGKLTKISKYLKDDIKSFINMVKSDKLGESVNESKKMFSVHSHSAGSKKFNIDVYDGRKNKDGSPFIGTVTANHSLELKDKIQAYKSKGYTQVDNVGKKLGIKYKTESVNEEITVGKMVKVDNPHWEAALGKKGPFKRKVKMIDGDNVFFTDGSNSSMKYIKEDAAVNEGVKLSLVDPNTNKFIKTLSLDRTYREAEKEIETLNRRLSPSQKTKGLYWKVTSIGESVNEYSVNKKFGSKYDIGAGSMGSGTTFWNRKEEEFGDYKKIAHVSDSGKVTFYDKTLPSAVKQHIEDYVKTQKESVNEGRAFINAARKAKLEGKTEFEFNGKKYPVTIKD